MATIPRKTISPSATRRLASMEVKKQQQQQQQKNLQEDEYL